MGDDYKTSLLNKASISFEYLHTNSTTHEFVFGALAELVDNSRDANSTFLNIDYDDDTKALSFLDDGCGMSRDEMISVVSFGHSVKRADPQMVGKYGNGLKSGSMRVAKDFILFTKKNGILSCLFLSRTFHEQNGLKQVFVPTPSFYANDQRALLEDPLVDRDRHAAEMKIIYTYSPFTDADMFFQQFDRIKGNNGTLVVLYNLRALDVDVTELDFKDPKDIRISNNHEHREEEKNSLRAYLSALYYKPRMKMYLRGEKVQATNVVYTLHMTRQYKYMAKNLKACAKKAHEQCVDATKQMEERKNMANSDFLHFQAQLSDNLGDPEVRLRMNLLRAKFDECKDEVKRCKEREDEALKMRTNPQPLTFYFGLNIHHRNRYGMMVYNNGRLIDMYNKLAVQKERNDKGMKCLGVLGIVDVPYSVLAPTHNKQGFENRNEYLALLRAANEHMEQYWNDIQLISQQGGVFGFWKQFGYNSWDWASECTSTPLELTKRHQAVGMTIQCDDCLKWRHLEFQRQFVEKGLPSNWTCKMHPNALFKMCEKKEELPKIREGRLVPKEKPAPLQPFRASAFPVMKKEEIIEPEGPMQPSRIMPRRSAASDVSYREEPIPKSRLSNGSAPMSTKRAPVLVRRRKPSTSAEESEGESEDEVIPVKRNVARAPVPSKPATVSTARAAALPSRSTSNSRAPVAESRPVAAMKRPVMRRSKASESENEDMEPLKPIKTEKRAPLLMENDVKPKIPRLSVEVKPSTAKTNGTSASASGSSSSAQQCVTLSDDDDVPLLPKRASASVKTTNGPADSAALQVLRKLVEAIRKESGGPSEVTDEQLLHISVDEEVSKMKQKFGTFDNCLLSLMCKQVVAEAPFNEHGPGSQPYRAAAMAVIHWGLQGDVTDEIGRDLNLNNSLSRLIAFSRTVQSSEDGV